MKKLFCLFLFILTGCGGADNVQTPSGPQGMLDPDPPNTPAPKPTTWREGVFSPSDDFHQVCADLSKAYDQDAVAGIYVDENNWLRSWSHETYFWYDEIEDVDPACCLTPDYFKLMKTFETTASGNPKDRFSYSIPTEEFTKLSQAIEVGYGAAFRSVGHRDIRVAYVEPNSPASIAGLSRGTRILEADNINILTVTDTEGIDKINTALSPSEVGERHMFTIQDSGSLQERSVTMTAREINKDLVQNVSILTRRATGERVGYMLFNSHDRPAGLELIQAVQYFEANNIDDLVLDLRYNGGGLVWIAQMLSSMVAGPAKTGRVFLEDRKNDKHKSGSSSMFDLNSVSYGYGVDGGNTILPSLGLPRLFVLVGPETCSASESIINGLRGADVEIILIGSTTCGKPYGFLPTENCGTVYFSIDTHFVNAKGFGDYADGFPPSCRATDNFSYDLGDKEENLLATALLWILDGRCPLSTMTAGKSRQSEAAKTVLEPKPENIGPAITAPTRPPGAITDPPGSSEREELIEIPPFEEEPLQE